MKEETQRLRMYNAQRFQGGYTGPAVQDHQYEEERIKKLEKEKETAIQNKYAKMSKQEKAEIERKYFRELEENRIRNQRYVGGGSLVPSVGGYAAVHASQHGGGFNHSGHYGSPFQ